MGDIGLVDVDVFRSSLLKARTPLPLELVFEDYDRTLTTVCAQYQGQHFTGPSGDGRILCFESPRAGVLFGIKVLEELAALNRRHLSLLPFPIMARFGVHPASREMLDVPIEQRGTHAHSDLDNVGHLQKKCPVGRIAISQGVYETLGAYQQLFRPKRDDQCFISTQRQIFPQEALLIDGLTRTQQHLLPPIPFPSWDSVQPPPGQSFRNLGDFLSQPVSVVLGETSSRPVPPVTSAATSDAIGLLEVLGAISSNRQVAAGIDHWEDTADIVAASHVIVVGSGMVNIYAFAINELCGPVRFVKSQGRILDKIVLTVDGAPPQFFGPHATTRDDYEWKDCGLMVLCNSPFNAERMMLWIAGISGMGTQAVAAFLRDIVVDASEALARANVPSSTEPIACVVGARPRANSDGYSIQDYYGKWRVSDYEVLALIDRDGRRLPRR